MAKQIEQLLLEVQVYGEQELKVLQTEVSRLVRVMKEPGSGSAGTGLSKSMDQTTAASRRMGRAVQNASYQVADIAVQADLGIDPLRIMGQQGSQLLAAFGPMAAVLGAAVAGISLFKDELGLNITTIASFTKKAEELLEINELLGRSQEELNQVYGASAGAMSGYIDSLKELNEITRLRELKTQVTEIAGVYDTWFDSMRNFGDALFGNDKALSALRNSLNNFAEGMKNAEGNFELQIYYLEKMVERYDRYIKTVGGINKLTDEQIKQYQALKNAQALVVESTTTLEEKQKALKAASDIESLQKQTQLLGIQYAIMMNQGVPAMEAMAEAKRRIAIYEAGGNEQILSLLKAQADLEFRIAEATQARADAAERLKAKQKADQAAAAAQRKLTQEIEAMQQAMRTADEVLFDTIENIERLVEAGLDAETAIRAMQKAFSDYDKSLEPVKDKVDDLAITLDKTFKTGFADMFKSAREGVDALGLSFNKLAESILDATIEALILKPLMDSITQSSSGSLGSIFSGLFGGGKMAGGPVAAGVPYIVGERGPELFTPSTSGNITPNNKMGGNTNINVINNNGSEVSINEREGSDGQRELDVYIDSRVQRTFSTGSMDRLMAAQYGVKRQGR